MKTIKTIREILYMIKMNYIIQKSGYLEGKFFIIDDFGLIYINAKHNFVIKCKNNALKDYKVIKEIEKLLKSDLNEIL